jgi:membrane-bound lytic murein transglycosylase B
MTRRPMLFRALVFAGVLALIAGVVLAMNAARASRQAAIDAATAATTAPPVAIAVSGSDAAPTASPEPSSPTAPPDATPKTGTAAGGGPATLLPATRPTDRVDRTWLARTAAETGIPARALLAYASAQLIVSVEKPACGIGWNTLAGIGSIESNHGRHGGAVLGDDGYPNPPIRGIPLDGTNSARIPDTDGGKWDGDPVWDRAVGPMQFIPSTWKKWGADGNGDGVADPNQIDDAALAAARYLCASGTMTTPAGWRAAIFSYNHLDSYVDGVAAAANRYAKAVTG